MSDPCHTGPGCECSGQPLTVSQLVEKYPALRNVDAATGPDLNESLAACGYRFAAQGDITRAQSGEYRRLTDCLASRVTKIIYCP